MMIFGNLMLLNLFLAILLKFISENQTTDEDGNNIQDGASSAANGDGVSDTGSKQLKADAD